MMTKTPDRFKRKRAQKRGKNAETLAAWWLRLKGFRIISRSFRRPVGEIDIIARRGQLLCFVEVKSRAKEAQALAAVTAKQQSRIARAARAFLQQRSDLAGLTMRFDILVIAPGRLPRHLKGAWRTEASLA